MAVLQKIRSKGALLLIIVGVGLFAFIGEEFVRSIGTAANERKNVAGEVYGDKISSQDFQELLEQYEEAVKFLSGKTSLSEEETAQAVDAVWQSYVNFQLVSHECEKLGLTVTDAEVQDVLKDGSNQMLARTPFTNQQGRFDVTVLKQFLTEYDKLKTSTNPQEQQYVEQYKKIFNYWKFVEKTLREGLLQQKYQILLASTVLSNPVEAKMNFEATVGKANLMLASYPLTLIADNAVKITDEDLKKKYEETKEDYRQLEETRDIKYVTFKVKASVKDKAELNKEMKTFAEKIRTTDDMSGLVRMSNSLVSYNNIPITKNALPQDIQGKLDSMSVGTIAGPYYQASDNTDNIIKLISKVEAPDSVEIRTIQVAAATPEQAHKSADSIFSAIKAGADFEALAKKYNQKGEKQWIVSNQYEQGTIDEDNAKMLNAANTMQPNEVQNISFMQGNIVMQVTDRKAMTTKYNVAVIKRAVQFSKETYSKAYNNFSRFVSLSKNIQQLEKNAPKFGYTVQTRQDLQSNEHYVANVTRTKEAMRWIYNEDTNPGDLSPLYECGDNDNLMIVELDKIHKKGYRSLDDVKDLVRADVLREKKAEILASKLAGVKSIAAAKAVPGAVVDSLNAVTFNGTSFIRATGATEPRVNGSVWRKKANQFVGPIKGNSGVYLYQVLNITTDKNLKYNEAEQENSARTIHMRNMSQFGTDLYLDGKVVDHRYLFF